MSSAVILMLGKQRSDFMEVGNQLPVWHSSRKVRPPNRIQPLRPSLCRRQDLSRCKEGILFHQWEVIQEGRRVRRFIIRRLWTHCVRCCHSTLTGSQHEDHRSITPSAEYKRGHARQPCSCAGFEPSIRLRGQMRWPPVSSLHRFHRATLAIVPFTTLNNPLTNRYVLSVVPWPSSPYRREK